MYRGAFLNQPEGGTKRAGRCTGGVASLGVSTVSTVVSGESTLTGVAFPQLVRSNVILQVR
jgi:hypothetical protein